MRKFIYFIMMAAMLIGSLAFAAQKKAFDGNNWLSLSKRERVQAVTNYIAAAKKSGITIKKTPVFYCKRLDGYYADEKARGEPVEKVLKTSMIMEYDWSVAGKSKDDIARQWLGDDVYKKNKDRLSKQK